MLSSIVLFPHVCIFAAMKQKYNTCKTKTRHAKFVIYWLFCHFYSAVLPRKCIHVKHNFTGLCLISFFRISALSNENSKPDKSIISHHSWKMKILRAKSTKKVAACIYGSFKTLPRTSLHCCSIFLVLRDRYHWC
jgi:hypothetical protein